MNDVGRYEELVALCHQRKLDQTEIDELAKLSLGLDKPNPLLSTQASVFAKIVIINAEGRVLILWRSEASSMPGRSDLPGGGIDFGEEPMEAVKREAREEAGLQLERVEIVEAIGYISSNGHYGIMLGYIGMVAAGEVGLSWEHSRYEWMSFEQALQLADLPIRHKRVLKAAQARIKA